MKKIKILSIGGDGMVGTPVNDYLSKKYEITDMSLSPTFNITKPETLTSIANDEDHQIVLYYAAKTDVDGCEKEKELGVKSGAYIINVEGIGHVLKLCKRTNKKIIYISTDFVFSGQDTPVAGYKENDMTLPINWYGKTKLLAEEAVQKCGLPFVIVRIGYPYGKEFPGKKDFVHAIASRLRDKLPVAGITDQIITPTFIGDIASSIDLLIDKNMEGIFHLNGSQSLSPYDAAMMIADEFKLDKDQITRTTGDEFYKNRAPRPFNLTINNDKIEELGIRIKSFQEGLKLI